MPSAEAIRLLTSFVTFVKHLTFVTRVRCAIILTIAVRLGLPCVRDEARGDSITTSGSSL
jgi:hypothetical protein